MSAYFCMQFFHRFLNLSTDFFVKMWISFSFYYTGTCQGSAPTPCQRALPFGYPLKTFFEKKVLRIPKNFECGKLAFAVGGCEIA